ncbi:hypothetical protein TruAng_007367 [Truncatella angustata]|nr:hypothetical protein TruAng_007367 [Truncatella angustata]
MIFEKTSLQVIDAAEEKLEPNPWVRRVGWARHLQDFLTDDHMTRLRESISIPTTEEPKLQVIWESFMRMIHDAQDRVCGLDSGAAVLFEMHRETEVKPLTPFVATMEKDSWSRYYIFVGQILMYIFRTQEWKDEDRPAYTLTRQQGNIFDRLSAIVGSSINNISDADDADI